MTNPTSETAENRLRRLKMRSWRRGMKEMDLILGQFADTRLTQLNPTELDAHEGLMAQNDQDLYAWINGAKEIPKEFDAPISLILRHLSARSF